MTPFSVKNAASRRRVSRGRDERVLVEQEAGDRRDPEPVEDADLEAEPGEGEEADRGDVAGAGDREGGPGRRNAPAASGGPGPGRRSRSKSA